MYEIAAPSGAGMKRIVKRVAIRLGQAVEFILLFVIVAAAESDHYVDLARGKTLVISGDCITLHTSPGGTPFGECPPLQAPFGQVVAPNITPDDMTGIDSWSSDDFVRPTNEGTRPIGDHLNPAFPYAYYNKVTRVDLDATNAYLRTLAPITNQANRNMLPSPFNLPLLHAGLGKLSFDEIVRYLNTGQTVAGVASKPNERRNRELHFDNVGGRP
ncbi:hypothetical protein ACVWW4_003944 [Bradyrhizobium sp. LB7.1]